MVTGGAVRLSDSGLGCPTWPTCQGDSLTPTGPSSYHKVIEFTNRQLTGVLVAVAVITALLAWRQRRELRLAVLALAIIPVQAVIGGISVLTDLNPWVVALHLLTSMANIAVTVVLLWRLRRHGPTSAAGRRARGGGAPGPADRWSSPRCVLAAGTVVTGAGPHSGAKHQSQRIAHQALERHPVARRPGHGPDRADRRAIALLYAVRAEPSADARAAMVLLGIELLQGVIGYVAVLRRAAAGARRPAHVRRLPGLDRRARTSCSSYPSGHGARQRSEQLGRRRRSTTPTTAPTTVPLSRMN